MIEGNKPVAVGPVMYVNLAIGYLLFCKTETVAQIIIKIHRNHLPRFF